MNSPITGSEMKEKTEYTTIKIKGKNIKYVHHFYECPDTKERFTTTELDELNLKNIDAVDKFLNNIRYLLNHEDYIDLNINQKIQAKYFYLNNSI